MKTLEILILSFAAFLALLYVCQRVLIFPGAYHFSSVAREDGNLRVIPLETEDGIGIQLYTFAGNENKKRKRAVLVIHGNADLAARKIYDMEFLKNKYDIYALEFRGFNGNKGYPSEKTLNSDAKTALGYLRKQDYKEIIYYGHSIGTAVAARLVREEAPLALILEAPFDNLVNAANGALPFLPKFLLRALLKDKYDSAETLAETAVPNVLVMHGAHDNILDIRLGQNLFAKINSPNKVLKIYERADHNDILQYGRKDISDFLKSVK